jgi:phosphatidylinositol alpha-mannosyltransferase
MAPLGRIAVRHLHHRTAVSEAARACANRFLGGDYQVIPNGIARQGGPVERPEGSHDECRVLFVGRNDPRKGLAVLLRATSQLSSVRVDLVGVDEDELEGHVAAIGEVPSFVRLTAHGRVSEERRRELLGAADLVCAPSLSGESFGLVLVEAMSAGVPVVASSIPGYLDVLSGFGRMVPAGDDAALAAAISQLAANRMLRRKIGEDGRRAAERFHWSRVTPRIVEAYELAIARHAAATRAAPKPVPALAAGEGPAPETGS